MKGSSFLKLFSILTFCCAIFCALWLWFVHLEILFILLLVTSLAISVSAYTLSIGLEQKHVILSLSSVISILYSGVAFFNSSLIPDYWNYHFVVLVALAVYGIQLKMEITRQKRLFLQVTAFLLCTQLIVGVTNTALMIVTGLHLLMTTILLLRSPIKELSND